MYNFEGNAAIYCSEHKQSGMIDVRHKKCLFNRCKINPGFNFKGEIKALYCNAHKQEGMINVKDKICIHEGCKTQSVYNYEGEKPRLYCFQHKKDGMINVKSRQCCQDGCKLFPMYNFEYETKGLYCTSHKKEGMVDVKHRKCCFDGCQLIPTYNLENEKRPIYCSIHKTDDMVNVKHKKCIFNNCKITACYNNEGETKPIYCTTHKKDGMTNVVNKKCIYDDCKITPCYNYEWETKAIYCSSHKEEGMVDVKGLKCVNDWCYTRANNSKYKGYCLNCYVNMFPDKPVSRNYKTKEATVVEYVKNKFPDLSWVCDKAIKDGCSKKRPDLLVDLGYQIIIIEIDENQHSNYECSCENKRIMELSQDLQHRPIIFIRFNPDKYESNGVKIDSCWGLDGRGMCAVKKTKKLEWQERLDSLSLQIEYWLKPENITDKMIETIHLFYS
jgi:hypothetical protein